MLARNQHLFYGNQVSDELTTGGVNNNHYTEGFAFMSLESTSYKQVMLDLKLDGSDVGSTPCVILDFGISFIAGPTTDVESIAALLSSSNTISSSQEYTFDFTASYNVAYTVGGVNYELIEKEFAISFSSGASSSD